MVMNSRLPQRHGLRTKLKTSISFIYIQRERERDREREIEGARCTEVNVKWGLHKNFNGSNRRKQSRVSFYINLPLGSQEQVLARQGKRAFRVQAIEVLYIVEGYRYYNAQSPLQFTSRSMNSLIW